MYGVSVKRLRVSTLPDNQHVNHEQCIICQTETEQKPSGTENGRKKVIEAADIRNDCVSERLKLVSSDSFVYHVSNECYKRYTLKKTLDGMTKARNKDVEPQPSTSSEDRLSRSMTPGRDPHSQCDMDLYNKKCVICGKASYNNDYAKFRISEKKRAEQFLSATLQLLDDVYTKTCDLQDVNSVFGADLYCHKPCIRNYIRKSETTHASSGSNSTAEQKMKIFNELIRNIECDLNMGKCFTLSYLSSCCNMMCGKEQLAISFTNRDIKMYLMKQYGENVSFCVPREANKPTLVFKESAVSREFIPNTDQHIFKECGTMLRQILLKEDFKLQDKFCDAHELEQAYNNIVIPEELLVFFSALYDCDLTSRSESYETGNSDATEPDSPFEDSDSFAITKWRKLLAVYQILYYIINNGKRRTPLHMMNSEAIHSTCKSKTLISSLNRFGLAMSYDEVLRYHTDLASYINDISKGQVPLPSQFDKAMFSMGAFDNFDHEEGTLSGIGGTHDTVLIMVQDKPHASAEIGKPNISETSVAHGPRQFEQQLGCQELKNYSKSAKKPVLPQEYNVPENLYHMEKSKHNLIEAKDAAWTVSRLDLSNLDDGVKDVCENQTMPTWSGFNSIVTDENVPQKIIGFLPVIPHPVTEHATVYTSLKNFQDVISQLEQSQMPVFCDEGVYHIAREIIMHRPHEFSNIVLCLGSFHMIKIVMGAIGKFVDGSGAETILVESKVFGKNVAKSVIAGTHYTRSLKGLLLLSECIERLQWAEFFKINGVIRYMQELKLLGDMKDSVSQNDRNTSKQHLQAFIESSSDMLNDFKTFKSSQSEKSETFAFWNRFVLMVAVLRDLVRADREGDWELHLHSLQTVLPLFAACDKTNYLRWSSLYLEDMRKLPEIAPIVYNEFMAGKFAVKRTPGRFKAVGMDMCLEQTINRSQKSSAGIIGSTKRKQYVAKWEMIYHEMLAVVNLHREISGVKMPNTELQVNHEFSAPATSASEAMITDMITYIQEHENPAYVPIGSQQKLHNILTQEIMNENIRKDLLDIETDSTTLYETFRTERLVTKQKTLFDTIHRRNLQTFRNIKTGKRPKEAIAKDKRRQMTESQKTFDIARVRNYDIKHLLQFDLVDASYLFDETGLMSKPTKSDLSRELEKNLTEPDYLPLAQWNEEKTTLIVDVMGFIRRVNVAAVRTFGDLCSNFLCMVRRVCGKANRVDFIFDTYVQESVKDGERTRRCSCTPVDISNLCLETLLPVSLDAFWASSGNKVQLQTLLRRYILEHPIPNTDIVVSGTGLVNDSDAEPCMAILSNSEPMALPDLDVAIEEADVRIIPHALHAVNFGSTRIVLLSNDTDVIVIALNYLNMLKSHGLKELWIRAGVRNTTRYIPLHILGGRMGSTLCQVIIAVHQLTGSDSTSKFGTKAAGLKANPEVYLKDFGKGLDDINIKLVEEFLVQVFKVGVPFKTMDELRYYLYHHSKKTLIDLPPTSRATKGHILRAFYGTYLQLHCIDGPNLDASCFGFHYEDGIMKPSENHKLLPDNFPTTCKCTICATKRCPCRSTNVPCCPYCNCQGLNKGCKNPVV